MSQGSFVGRVVVALFNCMEQYHPMWCNEDLWRKSAFSIEDNANVF